MGDGMGEHLTVAFWKILGLPQLKADELELLADGHFRNFSTLRGLQMKYQSRAGSVGSAVELPLELVC